MNLSRLRTGAVVAAAALALTACASSAPSAEPEVDGTPSSVQVEDNNGVQTIATPPKSVVATDNRTFETLAAWGIKLSAAAVALMPGSISYVDDESIIDLGSHREPNLEAVVAVQPDLIINGQRFATFHDDFVSLVPEAVVLELDPREGEPLDQELKRQTAVLGEIFGKQKEAKKLIDAFDAAIERVKNAYTPGDTVMAAITSGGQIGYVAPNVGRTLGPLFEIFGFTPALEVPEGSDDHQGDDISVEAIAASNPDWILVMDRDAAVGADDPAYTPGNEIIDSSEALKNVTAVKQRHVVYMPADAYTNEGIQTYTEFFNAIADALEGQKKN